MKVALLKKEDLTLKGPFQLGAKEGSLAKEEKAGGLIRGGKSEREEKKPYILKKKHRSWWGWRVFAKEKEEFVQGELKEGVRARRRKIFCASMSRTVREGRVLGKTRRKRT